MTTPSLLSRGTRPSPPSLPGETTAVDSLRPFAGEDVFIEYQPSDAETKRATSYIISALTWAGLNIKKKTSVDGTPDGVEIQHFVPLPDADLASVQGEWRSSDSAEILVKFLHSYNWVAKSGWPLDEHNHLVRGPTLVPTGGLRIRIGMLPAVLFVNPKGAAPAVATREKVNKQMEEQQSKRDAEILKSMTPQEATKFKAQRERQNRYRKELEQKYFESPCEPMDSSFW